MADLSDIQASQFVKVIGSDSSGTEQTPVQSTSSGGIHGNLRDSSGNELLSSSSTPSLSATSLIVRPIPYEPQSYSAVATAFTVTTTPTDVLTIQGSGTKTIRISKVIITGTTTSGSPVKATIRGIKRSAANTGGTTVTDTAVPLDSNNSAATAVVKHYTANPSALGAAVGDVYSNTTSFQASGITTESIIKFESQPLVLRGTSEYLAINFNSTTIAGNVISITVFWEEV